MESLEATMASLVTIAIALFTAYGVLLVGFILISRAIRREDNGFTLAGRAPNWLCWIARHMVGFHRVNWDSARPRPRTPVV
jgi:hypothetical protein